MVEDNGKVTAKDSETEKKGMQSCYHSCNECNIKLSKFKENYFSGWNIKKVQSI